MTQLLLVGLISEFVRKEVLEKEILLGAKKGLQKLEAVEKDFWAKAKNFVIKSKERNNPFIPDSIEYPAENLLLAGLEVLEKEIKVRDLIERILKDEKTYLSI